MQGDIFCKWPTKFECLFCTLYSTYHIAMPINCYLVTLYLCTVTLAPVADSSIIGPHPAELDHTG